MPTSSKNHRRGHEDKVVKMGKLTEKSSSFHGRSNLIPPQLLRPKTDPDLLSGRKFTVTAQETAPAKLTKLLLNVTIQRSLGAIQVVISPESTVGDLIAAAVRLYVKEGRRPFLPTTDPSAFDLHYSQFSLESLGREEKLITLGSRNFFLCPRKQQAGDATVLSSSSSSSSCSNQAEKASKIGVSWLRFMDFLL